MVLEQSVVPSIERRPDTFPSSFSLNDSGSGDVFVGSLLMVVGRGWEPVLSERTIIKLQVILARLASCRYQSLVTMVMK